MSNIGLFAQGSKVYGENLLISNCGQYLIALNIGGDYDFKHCTFANFWPFSRQTPSILLNNYYEDFEGNIQNRDLINASFGNCIIDGYNENELLFDKSNEASFNYSLNHCVIKSTEEYWNDWEYEMFEGIMLLNNGQESQFIDYEINDFRLDSASLAIDAGLQSIAIDVPYDINGILRTQNPDIGCFEME